jgi:multidrug transporter EmrE-like cation transporter
MAPGIVALVLLAAVLHLTWNVLLKTAGDPLRTAFVGIAVATVVVSPVAAVAVALGARPDIPGWVLGAVVASGAVETAYFVALSRAYRHGELSVVYPTARGTAPLLAVAIGVIVLGERLTPLGSLGVAALLGGILALQRPWRYLSVDDARARTAAIAALGAGAAIAAYSAIDSVAVETVAPWVYAALLWPAMTVGLAGWLLVDRARRDGGPSDGGGLLAGVDPSRAVVGGLVTLAAYGLVLVAYSVAPLTAVAPLRESAVVLAAGWGALRLREGSGRGDVTRRIGAAGLVVLGIALLVSSG